MCGNDYILKLAGERVSPFAGYKCKRCAAELTVKPTWVANTIIGLGAGFVAAFASYLWAIGEVDRRAWRGMLVVVVGVTAYCFRTVRQRSAIPVPKTYTATLPEAVESSPKLDAPDDPDNPFKFT